MPARLRAHFAVAAAGSALALLFAMALWAGCAVGSQAPAAPEAAGCDRAPQPSVWPDAQKQALGVHPVGTTLTFDVPPGTASLSIISQGTSAANTISISAPDGRKVVLGNTVVPTLLRSPDGVVLYDDSDPNGFPADPSGRLVFYGTESVWTGAMTIPNTSAMLQATSAAGGSLSSGTWSLEVNDYAFECSAMAGCSGGSAAGTYDITVLTKPAPTPPRGTLDVALYLVTETLTAASARSSPAIQRMLSTMQALLGGGGVDLGNVSYNDIPASAKAHYASVDGDLTSSCDPFAQMFTLSQPGNTVNLFLVDEITSSSGPPGFTTVGQDGTIPGPSAVGGTVRSGAAVSVADLNVVLSGGSCTGPMDLRCGADQTAYVAAHETGHWLGLYHTTEFNGNAFDPLDDTLTCDCQACASTAPTCGSGPSAYAMRVSDCTKSTTCGGGDNLMFWLLDASSQGSLTPEQGEVMRANPAVQ